MKKLLITIFALITVVLVSCKKDGLSKSVQGTWNVVSDSIYATGVGPLGGTLTNKYIGVAGDHFIFTGNMLYVNAGVKGAGEFDTAAYTISENDLKLNYIARHDGGINTKGGSGNYTISQTSPNQLALSSSVSFSSGVSKEYIILSR